MFTFLEIVTQPMPEVQEAFLPYLLPFALYFLYKWFTPVKGKRIVLLGPSSSGKSQFLQNLQDGGTYCRPTNEGTSSQKYEEFEFDFRGRKIKIAPGTDFGGRDHFRKELLSNAANDCDSWIFFFDTNKYMKDEQYAKDVRAYWDNIYSYSAISKEKNCYAILGTHIDQLIKSEKAIKEIKEKIEKTVQGKTYQSLLNNFALINLRDPKMVKVAIEKVFPPKD